MSWDVFLFNAPPGMKSLDDLSEDFKVAPLGPKDEVIAKLTHALEIDFSDRSWGIHNTESYSIEFNMGADPVESIMLHVRGGGEVMGAIRAAADALGVRALDCSTGDWIDFESAKADDSWQRWQAYRDQIVKRRSDG